MNLKLAYILHKFNEVMPRYNLKFKDEYRLISYGLKLDKYYDVIGHSMTRYSGPVHKTELSVKESDYEKRKKESKA